MLYEVITIAFNPVSAYRVTALFNTGSTSLKAELNKRFDTFEEADAFVKHCANAQFSVKDITKKPS